MPRLAGIAVEGVSIAGIETSIALPELGVVFDMGSCASASFRHEHVLLSHGHVDHVGAVLSHAARRELNGLPPARYVASRGDVPLLDSLFAAGRAFARGGLPHRAAALEPDESLPLRPGIDARAFKGDHRIPSQGYVLVRRVEKLRAEHRERSGAEIAARRRAGETVTESLEEPLVAFSGDTRIDAIERCDAARRAKLLILEVTYLDSAHSVATARDRGHVHLDEVIERAAMFENEAILFHHFSARYDAAAVRAILRRSLPDSLRGRVAALI